MFQFSHSHSGDHEYCQACGQRLPRDGYGYGGPKRHNRAGIAVSILVHVLVLLFVLFTPKEKITLKPPAKEGELVYISPLPKSKPAPTPKPRQETKPVETAKAKPQPRRDSRAIAKAAPPKLETFVPPVQATMKPPTPVQEEDMQARVEAARKRRAEANPQPQQEAQESESDRALRVARANIMGAQGRNAAGERENSRGILSIDRQSSLSAEVRYYGIKGTRERLKLVHVELGSEIDIETAAIKKVIELIREEAPAEFTFYSDRLGRIVIMHSGKQYQAELETFLMKEFLPNYRRR